MGIRGLQFFVENCCPGAYYDVDIRELVRVAVHRGIEPVIIVDLFNIVRFIYGELDWYSGGQHKEYIDRVGEFLKAFADAGIRLVFIADGSAMTDKRAEWVRRRYQTMNKTVYPFYDALKRKQFPDFIKDITLPMLMTKAVIKYVFNHDVRTSLREADDEIAELAKEYKAIGILAQDSDYLIYQSGAHYLSMRELDWKSLRTKCYDSAKLAQTLNIRPTQLPLFAILAGNDNVDKEKLKSFHCWLVNYKGFKHPMADRVFPALGEYLNQNRFQSDLAGELEDLELIARTVFDDPSILPLLQRSLRQYFLQPEPNSGPDTIEQKPSGDSNWDSILELFRSEYTKNLSPGQYPIMIGKPYESSCALEDFRESHLIPPNGFLWESSRQRVYGILLKEKPGAVINDRFVVQVDEWAMNGPETLDEATALTPEMPENHPGLLYLHNQRTSSAQQQRRRLFAWCVDPRLDPSLLVDLAPSEICLLANLYKIQNERDKPVLEEWEVRLFILQFYCLQDYSAEDLFHLPRVLPTPRGVHLTTLYTRSYIPHINNAVGKPFPMEQTLMHHQLDGKLFQTLYNRALESVEWKAGEMDQLIHEFVSNHFGRITETKDKINKIFAHLKM